MRISVPVLLCGRLKFFVLRPLRPKGNLVIAGLSDGRVDLLGLA